MEPCIFKSRILGNEKYVHGHKQKSNTIYIFQIIPVPALKLDSLYSGEKYANDRGALMWNPTTDLGDCIGNNKVMTSSSDVKLLFSIASDDEQLEKDIMEFDQEKYDKVLDEFHEEVGFCVSWMYE